MTTWVALLRGVNVGGVTIRSADLAAVFRDLGFASVTTFLASGNVRFETDAAVSARPQLAGTIEKALRERFAYDAWIVLVTRDELTAAIAGFPFDADDGSRQPYVVFCSTDAARAELLDAVGALVTDADPVGPGAGVIYWNPEVGTSTDTPFAKILARDRYRAVTTTRNLRTLQRIAS